MKKILIALDYNPSAQKVAETGHALAVAMNAKVILFHAMADPEYYSSLEYSPIMGFAGYSIPIKEDETGALEKTSLHFLEKTKRHLKDESIEILVKQGEVADSIMKTAKELHVDVIVMGTHSRRWLDEILMGSATEKVVHHSTIPLFIVPTRHKK
ncbi:MAG: universal stress protein [Bacteroidota bacterium]